jgi:acyl carrier protein
MRCVSEVLGVALETIGPDTTLIALGAQSFDFVDLAIRLEALFGVSFPKAYSIPDMHTPTDYVVALWSMLSADGKSA